MTIRPTDARTAALGALVALESGRSAVLGGAPRTLPARERPLWLELTRGVERQRSFLDFVLAPLTDRGLPREPTALSSLRLGAHQLLHLPGVAAHAAVHETVARAGRAKGFVNAVLRRLQQAIAERAADSARPREEVALPSAAAPRTLILAQPLPDPVAAPASHHALRWALPQFLVQRWIVHHGLAAAFAAARASASTPAVLLRARPRHGGRDALAARLLQEGVRTEPGDHPLCLAWSGGGSPFDTAAFREGWFLAQDPTAVRAVEALRATPGDTVLDLCAAPGTKAALLADAVLPGGRVLAHDADASRLEAVADNARRLQLDNLLVVPDLAAVAAPSAPRVDRALVDAPCSNTGVLARRVEVRRRLAAGAFAALAATQRAVLQQALARVQPGGFVVYSTCSIEPEENGEVVHAVVAAAAGAVRIVAAELTLPDTPRHDGGYWALLEVVDHAPAHDGGA